MSIDEVTARFVKFRSALYGTFVLSGDTLMNLLEALSSNQSAASVVELSLHALFARRWSSLPRAIAHFDGRDTPEEKRQRYVRAAQERQELLTALLPAPGPRRFRLFATDVTPQPRLFAPTLKDRSVVYAPNAVLENKPITLGHQYSVLVYLPEKDPPTAPPDPLIHPASGQ